MYIYIYKVFEKVLRRFLKVFEGLRRFFVLGGFLNKPKYNCTTGLKNY